MYIVSVFEINAVRRLRVYCCCLQHDALFFGVFFLFVMHCIISLTIHSLFFCSSSTANFVYKYNIVFVYYGVV